MSDDFDCDLLIVGAGPTGMSAALALSDAGYKIMIIDKHEKALSYSRAILVNSKTLSLLKPYNVADKIIAMGHPCSSITINGPDGLIIEGSIKATKSTNLYPILLPQLITEQCLEEGLKERGITIDRPAVFKCFEQNDNYVESIIDRYDQQVSIRSKYLLGADGFHSTVIKGLGFNYNQSATPIWMYSLDAEIDWDNHSDANIWILNSGAALAMKIGNNKVRFAATSKQTFKELGISDNIKKITWENEFEVYFAQVQTYGRGRVWLAGDAAHVHSPVGGRGMNMGIADGISFAQAVIENDFIGYQNDRHAISGDWVRKNKLFTELICDGSIKGKFSRTFVRSIFKLISILSGKNAAKKVFETIAVG